MPILYADITNVTAFDSISLTESHDSSIAQATFTVPKGKTTADLSDLITIDLGYTTDHQDVFQGYVKNVDDSSPDGITVVTMHDIMSRAVDYLVVAPAPDQPFVKQNIETGDLIQYVLEMAGLTNFDFDNTSFIFATGGSKAEINVVNAYDYCKQLTDLIAWNLWAESDGVIYLKNRKPFVMYNNLSQPGDHDDTAGGSPYKISTPISGTDILNISLSKNERDLRNKVVVYGANNLVRDASSETSYDPVLDTQVQVLPDDYYKSVVLSSLIITDGGFAQDACDYNLSLLNRVQYNLNMTIIGRPDIHARRVIQITYTPLGISGWWYIYSCDHDWSKNGYTCNLSLRK
jgi:hypothetical protein